VAEGGVAGKPAALADLKAAKALVLGPTQFRLLFALPCAMRFIVLAMLLALGACTGQAPPPPPSGDPITFGHSVWCGTNPPSGYCMYD
jgi:hypothetical protein